MNPIRLFFHWPEGGVWSNIVASALWAIPGYFWGRYHFKKIHRAHTKIHKHLGIGED